MLAYYQDTEDIGTKPHPSQSVSASLFWKCLRDGEWICMPHVKYVCCWMNNSMQISLDKDPHSFPLSAAFRHNLNFQRPTKKLFGKDSKGRNFI